MKRRLRVRGALIASVTAAAQARTRVGRPGQRRKLELS